MCIVVGSGVFGRYEYSRLPKTIHGQFRSLESLEREREGLAVTILLEIKRDAIVLEDSGGVVGSMPNDVVAVFAGGELPTKFLRACGIEIDTKFGEA